MSESVSRKRVKPAPVGDLHVLVALRAGDIWAMQHPSDMRAAKRLARVGLVEAIGDGSLARITNKGTATLRRLALLLYVEEL